MAIIENDIQYNWVRKRVSKLKEKVDENTSLDNRYRIELELLSKIEKEYSDEYSNVLEQEIKAVTNNVEKKQINIYEGLPMILEKIKAVALAAVIGKSDSWTYNKLNHCVKKGFEQKFNKEDLPLINNGLEAIGDEILQSLVAYSSDRDAVIAQIKNLRGLICMPYIYEEVLKVKKSWFDSRMRPRNSEGKASSFKEDDIHAINKAAMQIANELKSTEFIL